jgi:hypothetical protein
MVAHHVPAADDVANDLSVLSLPRIAIAEALTRQEEQGLDAELIEHVQQMRGRTLRGTIIECEQDHPPAGAALDRQSAREASAGHIGLSDHRHLLEKLWTGLGMNRLVDDVSYRSDRRERAAAWLWADFGGADEGAPTDDRQDATQQPKLP